MFFVLFTALLAFSTYMVISILLQSEKEEQAFKTLASSVRSEISTSQYDYLKQENEDFFGWISIEGTALNYPVMYTPNDPEYYLRRAFDKSSSQSGVPFLDANYSEGSLNYLLYGHNMKNGTMFSTLMSYTSEEFFKEHPIIKFDTLQESGEYMVLAAFYSEAPLQEEGGFKYYQYANLMNQVDFETYLQEVTARSLYSTEISAEYNDQLLTLSTCSYHAPNGRFIVVAKKINFN